MAKKVKDEDLILNVIVNGNQGKKELGDLSRSIKDTTKEVGLLEKQEAKLRAAGKKDTAEYKAVVASIRQKNDAIEQSRNKLIQLVKAQDVAKMSSTELKANAVALKKAMDNSVPGSERWNIFKNQLDAVNNRIAEVKVESTQTGSALERMSDRFNKFFGVIAAGVASFFAAISGAKQAINDYAELDDVMGGVQKTTGLTKDEVKELNQELKGLVTRTTQEDLLGLGRIGGKLGVGDLEEIEGFVRATDQIVVALNEDLGGDVEETVNQVGKLVDIFNLKDEYPLEEALIRTGSTVNDLGAATTANEGYMVDFTQRVAGIAPAADISIQNVLGLAATLDTLGQSAEVSGTAYANIIPDMFRNTGAYAKVAGMDIKSFTDLLNKDANEAFIRVLEGIKGNNSGLTEMVHRLDDLGVDGARSVSVLNALANNTELLRQQQDLSIKSFAEGTSIGKEYNTMNSTAQAQLERSRKELHLYSTELGERLFPIQTASNSLLSTFIRTLSTMTGFLFDNWRVILSLTAGIAAYNAVQFISNGLSKQGIIFRTYEIALAKTKVFWDNVMTGSMHLLSAAYALVIGNIAAARAEMIAFNLVTKLNPIAMLIAVLVAGGTALLLYTRRLTDAEKAQRLFNEVKTEATKAIVEEKNSIDTLIRAIKNETLSKTDRLSAVKNLRDIMPEYLKAYSDEEILAGKATKAVKEYVSMLASRARADAALKRLTQIDERKADVNRKITEGYGSSTWMERLSAGFRATNGKSTSQAYLESLKKEVADLEKQSTDLLTEFEKDLNAKATEPVKVIDTTGSTEIYESEAARKKREKEVKAAKVASEKARRDEISAENKAYQDRLKAADLFGKSRSGMTTDELEKLAVLEQEHLTKIAGINAKGDKFQKEQTSSAIAELEKRQRAQQKYRDSLINTLNEEVEQENEAHLQRVEKAGLTNVTLEDLQAKLLVATQANNQKEVALLQSKIRAIETLEAIHQANLNKIDAKTMKDGIEAKQRAYETELADLRIRNNIELSEVSTLADAKALLEGSMGDRALANITTLDQAKKALQKIHQAEETELTKKHLEGLLRELQASMSSGEFEGLNLSDKILSDEEKEALEKKILEVKNLLAQLKNPTSDNPDDAARKNDLDKVDILGFSAADWEQMFQNLADGKIGVDDLAMAAKGLVAAWSMYNQFVEAGEKKQLQEFESATNKKKTALKKQLDSGKISQEKYNEQVEKLDADLDQKKAELDYKAAKREKGIALMNAVINTAAGVAKALPNLVLAAIVGSIGALQIGTIMKTPLPEIPGREDGGPFDDDDNPPYMAVRRSQDGRKFRAKNDPGKRGFVNRPTVLVGESGSEFVVNNAGVSNPSIRPVLSAIDTAQRNGTISTLNLEQIMANRQNSTRISGRASGGSFNDNPVAPVAAPAIQTDPEVKELLIKTSQAIAKLNERLEDPITAEVVLLGKNGFNEKQKELTDLQSKNTL